MPTALFSVFDKSGLVDFARQLAGLGWRFIASGGTATVMTNAGLEVTDVSGVTGAPEMLGGRVKTLHPAIHAGILARPTEADLAELATHQIQTIDLVVCNLYPFEQTVAQPGISLAEAIEQIDIGGVALLRAAAKNYERVGVICDPADYDNLGAELRHQGGLLEAHRAELALKAFNHTAAYDEAISAYLREQVGARSKQTLPLRYGANPNQKPAHLFTRRGKLPLVVRNGLPGYINLLDALNSWQLVRELKVALDLPTAASFKHVSPAGAAVAVPLSEAEAQAYFVADLELTPLATAYARARGADRMSSFGDWIALSEPVDPATAQVISREVSDGIIAPGYEPEAFELLAQKKGGAYPILEIDPAYTPSLLETRQVFGLYLAQRHNDVQINADLLHNIVSNRRDLPDSAQRDLIVATLAVKYTQSNSVCYAFNGQVVGVGAGQQSRVHCVRLAGDKVDTWWLRQHPRVLGLEFAPHLGRADKNNAIDLYLLDDMTPPERAAWETCFTTVPEPLTPAERTAWLARLEGVALSSDAFFPFRDSLDRAQRSGVRYVIEPGGALRDDTVIQAADEYGMTLIFSGLRLFHH
jgi:phosphoribosylaminoimidazolecarboxamide formyltransferase/IMP cyclohydrolase